MTHAFHVNSWKPAVYHELHESKLPFVSRIEFIRSKLSIFSAHVSGVSEWVGVEQSPLTATPEDADARLRVSLQIIQTYTGAEERDRARERKREGRLR